jgi:two-component system, LytTR family, sensor kinase
MSRRDLNTVSFWPLNLAGWAVFVVSMAASRIGRFPIGYMAATKTAMGLLGLAYTGLLLRPLYRRFLGNDASLLRVVGITAVASYAVAVLWTVSDSLADVPIERALLRPDAHITSVWQLFGGTLYDAFAILAWSFLYVAIKRQRALQTERERALRAEALANRARLDALRWQLNPHFLFNALNSISTLVLDSRNTEAVAMIARLGDLLRSTLETPSGREISLTAEMELVRRYLDIEQVRLGDRLALDVCVADDAWAALVPPMLLQPIVENAIRHAVSPRVRGGRVSIDARRIGGRLLLTVEDDGPGLPALGAVDPTEPDGIGLTNTRDRLQQHYGGAQRFALGTAVLGGLRVSFDLPYRE